MDASLSFVGTATTVLRLGRYTLLTDPNFLHRGQRAKLGYGLSAKRLTEPATTVGDLPALDGVLLSHLHGDHFDDVARRELDRTLPIVTTPPAARGLRRWGFAAATGLDTWDSHTFEGSTFGGNAFEGSTFEGSTFGGNAFGGNAFGGGTGPDVERVRVTAVPGRHGPTLVHRVLPTVMGSIVDLERQGHRALRIYITGDTLNVPELRAVRDRYPDVDVMVAHLGGTRIGGVLVTMDAVQGTDLVELMRPGTVVPVHYDDYGVFRSPLTHFTDEMRRRGLDARLQLVARGVTVPLPVRPVPGGPAAARAAADQAPW